MSMVGALLPSDGETTELAGIAVHRPEDAEPFDELDRQRLSSLLPHLQRALQLHRRVLRLEQRAQTGFAALEAWPDAVVVASADGGIVFANTAAARLARHGDGLILGRRAKGLSAAKSAEARTLSRLVYDAARGGAGGLMRLTRLADGAPLAVLVSPLPLPYCEPRLPSATLALVIVKDMGAERPPAVAWLKTFYGFTEAEAQVALAVFAGKEGEEIALERGVSASTVRTQIRQILEKSGASSLRDVVRRLAAVPRLRIVE